MDKAVAALLTPNHVRTKLKYPSKVVKELAAAAAKKSSPSDSSIDFKEAAFDAAFFVPSVLNLEKRSL